MREEDFFDIGGLLPVRKRAAQRPCRVKRGFSEGAL